MFSTNLTTGMGKQELCFLKILLIKKIDKQNKRMTFVKEKWISEGQNSVSKR